MLTCRRIVGWAPLSRCSLPALGRMSIVVASTTSTQDSGLFGHIPPLFKAKTGIDVKVVSQGTGQALDTGRRGDADVVFVRCRRRRSCRRRLRREAPSGDVQRLHPGLAQEPPGRRQGQGHHRRIEGDQGQAQHRSFPRGDRSASPRRRAGNCSLPAWTSRRRQGPGTARSAREWERRSTPPPPPTPACSPTAAPGSRSRTAATSPHVVEGDNKLFNQWREVILVNPGQACAREEGLGQPSSTWPTRRRVSDRRLQDQRRAGCSSPTPPCRRRLRASLRSCWRPPR